MDKRERLAVIFRDTQQFYSTNPALMCAGEHAFAALGLENGDSVDKLEKMLKL